MPELICTATDPKWHKHRRHGVTATDIVAILGLSAYSSPWALYQQKKELLPAQADNDRWRLGRELEPYIMGRWGEAHPDAAYSLNGPELWRSTARPWQFATPDSVIYSSDPNEGLEHRGVLECKSWADADRHRWDDQPPPAVRAQVLWQMDTMNVSTGHVGVLFLPSGEFRSYVIEHADSPVREYPHDIPGPLASSICEACADIEMMRTAARDFLDRIDRGDPPSVDGSAATLAALKAVYAPAPDVTRVVDGFLVEYLADARAVARQAEADAKFIEAQLREQAGPATILTDAAGTKLATRTVSTSVVKEHKRTTDSWRIAKNGKDTTDDA